MLRTHHARLVTAASCCAALWLGCASASHDRVGGIVAPVPVVLTLAVHGARDDVRDWAAAVGRLSHGSLRVELRAATDDPRGNVADVRAGRADLAAVPARAFDAMGVTAFDGLLAPFALDSYGLER